MDPILIPVIVALVLSLLALFPLRANLKAHRIPMVRLSLLINVLVLVALAVVLVWSLLSGYSVTISRTG